MHTWMWSFSILLESIIQIAIQKPPLTELTPQLPDCGAMWCPHYRWNNGQALCVAGPMGARKA